MRLMSRALRQSRETRRRNQGDLASWHEEALPRVPPELLALAETAVSREADSRAALNARLTSTITLAGALLVAAFALSKNAADLHLHGTTHTAFSASFLGAVALLVVAMILSAAGIAPEPRYVENPQLLRYWARHGDLDESLKDRYKLDVALIEQLAAGNSRRGRILRLAQRTVAAAILFAAAGAVTLFVQ